MFVEIPAGSRNKFFRVYKDLETKKVDTRGCGDRAEAERVIADARARAGRV